MKNLRFSRGEKLIVFIKKLTKNITIKTTLFLKKRTPKVLFFFNVSVIALNCNFAILVSG